MHKSVSVANVLLICRYMYLLTQFDRITLVIFWLNRKLNQFEIAQILIAK